MYQLAEDGVGRGGLHEVSCHDDPVDFSREQFIETVERLVEVPLIGAVLECEYGAASESIGTGGSPFLDEGCC